MLTNMEISSSVEVRSREDLTAESKISLPVYFLVCLFGLGSWLAINGIWMELPVLVDYAPEKWTLPSYLTVITEVANVGPLLYFVGNRICPRYVHERTTIYAFTVLGSVSYILLAFLWDRTSYIFGAERSSALIILSFSVALVDCTSTVTFLPFMAILPKVYMSALFTGENMSALLPSFVSLIQGVEEKQNSTSTIFNNGTSHNTTETTFTGLTFGPKYFFLFLVLMLVTSGAAFAALNHLPLVIKHHVLDYSDLQKNQKEKSVKRSECSCNENESDREPLIESTSSISNEPESVASDIIHTTTPEISSLVKTERKLNLKIVYLLLLQAWINCMSNGVISQIQAFACEPYGATAYHLAVTLSGIGSALVCIAYMWIPSKSVTVISVCGFVFTVASAYIITLAAQSPTPILKGTNTGSALVVLAFIVSGIFVNYAKVAICTIFRELGHQELFWCGIAIQVGSFVGAIVMFFLVNVAKFFKQ